jgi:hypothetical protein
MALAAEALRELLSMIRVGQSTISRDAIRRIIRSLHFWQHRLFLIMHRAS